MPAFIDFISCFFDNVLLYIYFQTMFARRKRISPWLIILIFLGYDLVYWTASQPWFGNTSYLATILRAAFTDISYFLLSYMFCSKLLYRILVAFIYSSMISICENASYYIISHFTDTSIVLDTLPDTTFTAIALFSDILILFITMILHIILKGRKEVQSTTYSVLLLLTPLLSCIMESMPTFFQLNAMDPYAYLSLTIFLLTINIINYVLLQNVLRAETLETETELLTKQVELQKQKYQQLGESYKSLRGFMHDTKKHVFFIETCVNEKQYDSIIPYCREMMSDLEARYCTVNTGNLVIDAFISDLILQTKRHDIKLSTSIKVEKDRIPCDDYHLAIMLGNLIDNAMNACKEELGGEINIKIQTVEHVFAIYITNTCHFSANQDLPKSLDNLDFIHGYGLKNVKNSAEACGGFCRIDYTDCIYSATVIIPLSEKTLPSKTTT